MTHNEKKEHQQKCRKVMIHHLAELGYPNLSNQEIANEFRDMWRKLEEAGLVVEGMSFEQYMEFANFAYLKAEMDDIAGI